MKYIKSYYEKLGDKISAPSTDDVLGKLDNLTTSQILKYSIEYNFIDGIKYILNNRETYLSNDETYILEKYFFNLHQNEEKDFEKYIIDYLNSIEYFPSKYNDNIIIYKKENVVLFNYQILNKYFYFNSDKLLDDIKKNYNIEGIYIKILITKIFEKHFNVKIDKLVLGYIMSV